MFRLQVTIIKQTFSTWTCMFSAYIIGSYIVYIYCVEFQTFRLIKKLYRLNELLRL